MKLLNTNAHPLCLNVYGPYFFSFLDTILVADLTIPDKKNLSSAILCNDIIAWFVCFQVKWVSSICMLSGILIGNTQLMAITIPTDFLSTQQVNFTYSFAKCGIWKCTSMIIRSHIKRPILKNLGHFLKNYHKLSMEYGGPL